MNETEKLKHVRAITQSPMNKVAEALKTTQGDVEKAISWLISQKAADATDIQKRSANSNAVFSYVHSGRIGAMIVLAAQTDFVLRNEMFADLAKNLCMHIVSAPATPEFVDKASVPEATLQAWTKEFSAECSNKPANIQAKIVEGKIKKRMADTCLMNQKFVKDDQITIAELITKTSATVGEKIEVKKFVRLSA
jgi:elongation factor Ts